MPIVNPISEYPQIPTAPAINMVKDSYNAIEVDTQYDPVSNLLVYVEGSSYTVDYYSQVLTKDSALAGEMQGVDPIYQQYIRIRDLELKVNSAITYTQDTTTGSITGTGSATIYAMTVIPNVGDMFIGDMGDGASGIFRITVSERKSIFKNTVYTIEYVLIETSVNQDVFLQRIVDIDSKIVDTVIYVKDFLAHGQNPLIHVNEYKVIAELGDHYHSLTGRYFKTFVSNEFKTLLIPGQVLPTYDSFLTTAVVSFFNTINAPEVRNIRLLNVQDDYVMKATSIWDAIRQRDIKLFKYSFKRFGLISAKTFTSNPMLEGIYHSGISLVIYPKDPILDVDYETFYTNKELYSATLINPPSQIRDLSDLISDSQYEGLTLPNNPLLYKVLSDDYYVFSEHFYNKDRTSMSILELCLMDYLEDKAPNLDLLLTLCNAAHSWSRLEQIYFHVVLLILIKAAIRSI